MILNAKSQIAYRLQKRKSPGKILPKNIILWLKQPFVHWSNLENVGKTSKLEKKARMATGGGLFVPIPDDDAVDAVLNAVDIELSEAIDSETCTAGGSKEYNLDRNNVLQPVVVEQGSSPEPSKCLLLKCTTAYQ
ncbi:uncharacterized protein [Onthophagus taurus]|uniref:uncharacterized protein isoform X2 n=1 Tax=Onthophagus taurus TaxID=166361 RepID=UPI0039BE52C5